MVDVRAPRLLTIAHRQPGGAATRDQRGLPALLVAECTIRAPAPLRFDQPLSSSLGVRLLADGYSAFAGGRQPKAIAVVAGTGTGLIVPAALQQTARRLGFVDSASGLGGRRTRLRRLPV